MALYAISDLHLALSGDKPMDVFGQQWFKHDEKIKENWLKKVSSDDTVLIAGDISWSMTMEDSKKELEWIDNLPGRKIFIKGNHDYWWNSITKLNSMFDNMDFIQNNFFNYEDWAICGTRGWTCSGGENYTKHDEKIYERELIRLKLSLDMAVKKGYDKIIVMIHYPPTNERFEESEVTKIFKEYNVSKVIYGHLHGPALAKVLNGYKDGVEYIMTSCDYIDFDPVKILSD
ncbi:metallophosphoesterase [Clostridium algidicarnis]|uniref:metallophosphoesterase n=1 Tax=Clostridium algidicarnis TaxID=37659 RepID=UPI001C0DC40D|nr:metallophosphoesterase [Clostridium algidicarnis]MBU3204038.1 metallophosphoesterase [Clostridium algidicarnis]MBU3212192.1 metallophosphoesterase [Clostridium algidicarnis]MBU3221303.1 metallophosphoesterase [Clostridium algidicarnis]